MLPISRVTIRNRGKSPARFEQMNEALRTIEAMMFRGRAPGNATLELPIAAERMRRGRLRHVEAEGREAARVGMLRKGGTEARVERLVRASASLDPDGDAWMETPNLDLAVASLSIWRKPETTS